MDQWLVSSPETCFKGGELFGWGPWPQRQPKVIVD